MQDGRDKTEGRGQRKPYSQPNLKFKTTTEQFEEQGQRKEQGLSQIKKGSWKEWTTYLESGGREREGRRIVLLHGLTSSTAPEGLTDSSAKYNVLETNNDSHKFVPPQHKCAHTYKHTHTCTSTGNAVPSSRFFFSPSWQWKWESRLQFSHKLANCNTSSLTSTHVCWQVIFHFSDCALFFF